jgi:hypothetical protein
MIADFERIDLARSAVAEWLALDNDQEVNCAKTSEALANSFFQVAKAAGFAMGIVVTEAGYSARWSHPRVRGFEMPHSLAAKDMDDARVLACEALLRNRATLHLLNRL